ncbi:MAG: peptidylprolyl isomerase, partial [Pseudomonadota bacterium]|nr:peptidylprolyl isomerase [Pseudomonadota bacterium]
NNNNFLNHSSKTVQGWGYTVFGKVTEGMDIVNKISQVKTGQGGPFQTDVPQQPIVIEHIQQIEDSSATENK